MARERWWTGRLPEHIHLRQECKNSRTAMIYWTCLFLVWIVFIQAADSPERFWFLLYHAPSSGDFSSAISSSSSSSTSSAAADRQKTLYKIYIYIYYLHKQQKDRLVNQLDLLCRSTPSIRWVLSRFAADAEASGTPASSPHALAPWQILWQTRF